MLENGKIATRQFTILVILYIVGSAILIIPSILAAEAKQDAWFAAMLSVGVGLLILPIYIALGTRFPNMNFAQYIEQILGKWLGKLVSLLFFINFPFFIAALTLRNIGDFTITQIMPETPIQAIHIIFVGVVILGARLGLEPLARATEIFFPWVIFLFLTLVVFVSPQIEFENIQPIFGEGIKPILRASIPFISFPFLEPVIFLMLFPYVNRPNKTGKALFLGTLIGGLFLIIITALSILVIGADQSARLVFPSYAIAKKISIGHFLERIEVIIAFIWSVTIYVRLTLLFYITALGIAQTLNLKDFRFLTFPLGMILIVFSLVAVPNTTYLLEFNQTIWMTYVPTHGLFLPLILLGLAVLRKKRGSKSKNRKNKGYSDNRVEDSQKR